MRGGSTSELEGKILLTVYEALERVAGNELPINDRANRLSAAEGVSNLLIHPLARQSSACEDGHQHLGFLDGLRNFVRKRDPGLWR